MIIKQLILSYAFQYTARGPHATCRDLSGGHRHQRSRAMPRARTARHATAHALPDQRPRLRLHASTRSPLSPRAPIGPGRPIGVHGRPVAPTRSAFCGAPRERGRVRTAPARAGGVRTGDERAVGLRQSVRWARQKIDSCERWGGEHAWRDAILRSGAYRNGKSANAERRLIEKLWERTREWCRK